jgi:hypothetical protein
MSSCQKPYQPARYRIKVSGRLDESWSDWLGSMTVAVERAGGNTAITTLTGSVSDQAALHGLLARIRDLGLLLLQLERLD